VIQVFVIILLTVSLAIFILVQTFIFKLLAFSIRHFALEVFSLSLAECFLLEQLDDDLDYSVCLVNYGTGSQLFTEVSDAFKSLFNHFLVLLILEYLIEVREYNCVYKLLHFVSQCDCRRESLLPLELIV
jgi:hypothetical protein